MKNSTIRELNVTETKNISGGYTLDLGFSGLAEHDTTYNAGSLSGGHSYGVSEELGTGFGFNLFTGIKQLIGSIFGSSS